MKRGFKPYPKYKTSGVEWLGEIPEGWRILRWRFVVQNRTSPEPNNLDDETEVQFVPMELVPNEKECVTLTKTRKVKEVKSGYTFFKNGDVLIAKITPSFENGKGAIAENLKNGVGFGTTELWVYRPQKDKINTKYLFFLSKHNDFRRLGTAFMKGSAGQKRVPDRFIKDFFIPLPPKKEQEKIVDSIDKENERIDTIIEKQSRMIDLLKEKRSALITHAVTKGFYDLVSEDDPDFGEWAVKTEYTDSGVEWLGEIPANWELIRLKFLVLLKSGQGITAKLIQNNGKYPVYGGNGSRGWYDKYTHEGKYILIGRQGALCGNINYADSKFWASEHAVVANPLKEFEPFWLGELLRSLNLNQYSMSAAQPGLAVDRIKNIFIPLPPLHEQKAIAAYLDRETKKMDTTVEKIERQIELLREYKQSLITHAVTGKIDVREAVGE